MYALLQSAAISGMRGGAPVTDQEYEMMAPINAAKSHLTTTVPGALIGGAVGGPVGAIVVGLLSAVLFGAPKALAYDIEHNEQQRGGR